MSDIETFREVLGHYPTGVSLVTSLAEDGSPLGMIVGTFSSVSLDPPLVSFMPMKGSRTWEAMQPNGRFCINVLAANQQDRCGAFMRTPHQDRFSAWPSTPSPAGLPVLDGVVAWIECSVVNEVEAGDHWIVIGSVDALEIANPVAPLLYFQGGYGRFSPRSLISAPDDDIRLGVVDAERARPVLERVATAYDAESSCVVTIGRDALAVVGSATGPSVTTARRLGLRIPLVPPVGDLFAAFDAELAELWIDRRTDRDPAAEAGLRSRLDLVRQQGWSAALTVSGGYTDVALHQAFCAYTSGSYTPADERRILSAVAASSEYYSPDPIVSSSLYAVGSIVVPVRHPDGSVRFALRLAQLDRSMTGAELFDLASDLTEAALELESLYCAAPESATAS